MESMRLATTTDTAPTLCRTEIPLAPFKRSLALNRLRYFISTLVIISLTACGGGGGGGGSGSGGGGNDSSSGVRILHAAIDGSPMDVFSSARADAVTSKVFFADPKGYRSLPPGAQTLSLSRALDPSITFASFEVTSTGSDAYSILYYGASNSIGLRATILEDSPPSDISGCVVRFVNGVSAASSIVVAVSGGAGPQQVVFGGASDYIATAPGEVRLSAKRAADGNVVLSTTETLQSGRAYTMLVAGEAGYYTKGVLFTDK